MEMSGVCSFSFKNTDRISFSFSVEISRHFTASLSRFVSLISSVLFICFCFQLCGCIDPVKSWPDMRLFDLNLSPQGKGVVMAGVDPENLVQVFVCL